MTNKTSSFKIGLDNKIMNRDLKNCLKEFNNWLFRIGLSFDWISIIYTYYYFLGNTCLRKTKENHPGNGSIKLMGPQEIQTK